MTTGTTPSLDARIREIGSEIFARARRAGGEEGFFDRLMMQTAMRDPRIKAQLFRLVDVLPALRSPREVNRHLREYLDQVRDRLPWSARETLDFLPPDGLIGRIVAFFTLAGAHRMARRFIIAETPARAVKAIRKLRRRELAFTIDLLGEAVLSSSEAQAYQQSYLELIQTLSEEAVHWPDQPLADRDHVGPIPRVNVSIKLSSLFSQFDPIDPDGTVAAVRTRLLPILRRARQRGVFINFDMEQYAYKDVTLRIFREILTEPELAGWTDVGIAIQAYLKDSGDDLRALADWSARRGAPVWVRLVKGAYWDYETIIARQNDWPIPVFGTKPQTDANYEAQAAFLIQNHALLRTAIASHNIRSIAAALACAEQSSLPGGAIEFQLLHGMAEPIKRALVGMNQRVRVYAPVGAMLPGMAYFVRRLLENTSNESFLRAGFLEHVPEEKLLMNPLKLIAPSASAGDNGRPPSDLSQPFRNEPLADFSRDQPRQAMGRALAQVRQQFGRTYPLVIDGQPVSGGAWIDQFNSSRHLEKLGVWASASPEDAGAAIAAARHAFPAWRDMPAADRAGLVLRVAEILRRRRFELAAWMVFETAKPWREADGDVAEAIDYCEYYARQAMRLAGGFATRVPGEENTNLYEPRGVAAIIAPWNFPLAILLGMTTAALVTGNTAVMKPAEQSAIIGAKLMEIFIEAGLPPGVVNLLNGNGEEIGPVLVNDRDIAIVAFTGSRSVGLAIQEAASRTPRGQSHVRRVITEMGGKNAILIDQDADLDEAVHGIIASAFSYAGQKCSACSRAIVLAPAYEAVLGRLVEAARSIQVGPPEEPGVFYGPVIDGEAWRRILAAIERAKSENCGRLVSDSASGPLPEDGWYVGPHIFADVPPQSFLAQEEIFGPVLSVLRADDLDHALELANGTSYALTGGIYSRSPASIDRARREFRVGNLYINRKITGALVERQPFGGFKLSGIGSKAGGPDYLLQFTWPRTITENTMRRGFAPEEPSMDSDSAGGI